MAKTPLWQVAQPLTMPVWFILVPANDTVLRWQLSQASVVLAWLPELPSAVLPLWRPRQPVVVPSAFHDSTSKQMPRALVAGLTGGRRRHVLSRLARTVLPVTGSQHSRCVKIQCVVHDGADKSQHALVAGLRRRPWLSSVLFRLAQHMLPLAAHDASRW